MAQTNRWNRIIYRAWSPLYDRFVEAAPIRRARRRAHELLGLRAGERVVLVGVGTGADVPLLAAGVSAVGIDLSPDMLRRARSKRPPPGCSVALVRGDAEALPFDDESFDAAVLTLVLSVVPHPHACLRESWRVLRPGGRAVVFDKFIGGGPASVGRRLLNVLTSTFGTDINRDFDRIRRASGRDWIIERDEASLLGGAYRVVLLRKAAGTHDGARERAPSSAAVSSTDC